MLLAIAIKESHTRCGTIYNLHNADTDAWIMGAYKRDEAETMAMLLLTAFAAVH